MRILPAPLLTATLATTAALYLGYDVALALDPDDSNHLETPLARAVAVQLRDGPGALYGPFDGARPTVLIHAPLYYRLAALGAWPLTRLGVDPVAAALASGRTISLLATCALLAIASRLATLDDAPRGVGLWSALLIVTSPVFGSLPVTVRPDTLGVALQTLGVYLVLRELRRDPPTTTGLAWAYAAFGLALCVKQHHVAGPAVSTALLVASWWRGRAQWAPVVAAHAVGMAVVAACFGAEEWVTSGMMSRAVFVIPGELRRVAYASWGHVLEVAVEVAKRSVGLIALGAACLAAGRRVKGRGLDATLGIYLLAELVLMAALCLNSTGAWANYAMQAVVFAGLIVGRALARVALPTPAPRAWLAVAAALVLLAGDARLVAISAASRSEDRMALRTMLDQVAVARHAPGEIYFVGRPQHTRRFGRAELAHDEWLYGQFEAVGAVEPRARWLRSELATGAVRLVITPEGSPAVEGLTELLPALGYRPVARSGGYVAWERAGLGRGLALRSR